MASTTFSEMRSEPSLWRSIRWSSGAMAGLIVGSILFFVSRGIPWVGSGVIDPSIMGLEVAPGTEATPSLFFGVLAAHMGISALYGVLIAAIAHSFRPMVAGFVGGLIGLVLYFVDYALFAALFSNEIPQREIAAVITHIAFGIITAETYKGMVRRRRPAPLL
jgi:hypothetical protein